MHLSKVEAIRKFVVEASPGAAPRSCRRTFGAAGRVSLLLGGAVALLVIVSCQTTQKNDGLRKQFTAAETAEIKAMLSGHDPADYRIVLPVFRGSEVVGTQTYGTLPLAKVERLAQASGIEFDPLGNIQTIFTSGACSAGSHVCTASAAVKLGEEVQNILNNLDRNSYVWVR